MSDPDKYHIHEALDRCHIVCANIDDHLLGHPAVVGHPEIEDLIQRGQKLIAEAYQAFGALSIEVQPAVEADAKWCGSAMCPNNPGSIGTDNLCTCKRTA